MWYPFLVSFLKRAGLVDPATQRWRPRRQCHGRARKADGRDHPAMSAQPRAHDAPSVFRLCRLELVEEHRNRSGSADFVEHGTIGG